MNDRRRGVGNGAWRAAEAAKAVGVWLTGTLVAGLAIWKAAELLAHVVVFGW